MTIVASFTTTVSNTDQHLVQFQDTSTGVPTVGVQYYHWIYGDGQEFYGIPGNPGTLNPTHSYTAGTWTAQLIITYAYGASSVSSSQHTINISHSTFQTNPDIGYAPLTVNFTDTSEGYHYDQFYNSVTLLAHFDGLNEGTTFTDSSSYHTAMSIAAGVPVTANTERRFGPTSLYCPISSSAPGSVYVANPANRFVFQDDFTIECWVYRQNESWNIYPTIMRKDFGTGGGYWLLRIEPDGKYHFSGSGSGGGFDFVSTVSATTFDNNWVNIAVTRSGNILYFFFNGVLDVVTAYSGFIGSTNAYTDDGQMRISQSSGNEYWTGYIDEVRITKGICRYNGNYTVATASFPDAYAAYDYVAPNYWYWTFGNGAGSTAQNPNYTYATPGNYSVVLQTSFQGEGTVTSSPAYITVTQNPAVASFGWIPTVPVANSVVLFNDTSTSTMGPITGWLWTFDNGPTSTQQNPQHTFTTEGNHIVRLEIFGSFGSTTTSDVTIYVGRDRPYSFASPWCGMQFFDNDGAPLSNGIVSAFQENGYSPATLYADNWSQTTMPSVTKLDRHGRWLAANYSDWYEASLLQPQTTSYNMVVTKADHTTVTQTLEGSNTQQLYSGGKNVTVRQDDPYNNVFYLRSSSSDPFHNQGRTYAWDAATTAEITSDGVPSDPGSYLVSQISTSTPKDEVSYQPGIGYKFHRDGAYLIETVTKWGTIAYPPSQGNMRGRIVQQTGILSFAAQTFNPCQTNGEVSFTSSTSDFESYTYSATKNDVINIFHYMRGEYHRHYTLPLKMTVRITRYGSKFAQVREAATSAFRTKPTSPGGDAPVTVTFEDQSTGNPTRWLWDFGDGNTATSQNVKYTYTTGGTFTPTLTAYNSLGTNGPVTGDPITVAAPPPIIQWILTFHDDTGTVLPLSVIANDPVMPSDVTALIDQLNGFMWTRNDNVTPAYFNNPPEPQSTNNVISGGRDYFFQDHQYSYGRWLHYRADLYVAPTITLFPFTVSLTNYATVNTVNRTFFANAGQLITCCTQGLTGTYTNDDTFIRLVDNTNTDIMYNDDCGNAPNSLASFLTYTATYSGNYTIKIGGYADGNASGVAGYQVT